MQDKIDSIKSQISKFDNNESNHNLINQINEEEELIHHMTERAKLKSFFSFLGKMVVFFIQIAPFSNYISVLQKDKSKAEKIAIVEKLSW